MTAVTAVVPKGAKSVGVRKVRPLGEAKYRATTKNPNSQSLLASFPMSQSLGVKCAKFGLIWELLGEHRRSSCRLLNCG